LRVYVAGQVCVEAGNRLLRERELPGPQGRHLLAFLAAEHSRAVGTDEIADELWDGAPPAAWATSLKALVSRVRAALTAAGLDGRALLVGSPGIYRFRVPTDGWVDLDAARSATHAAEAHLAAGRLRDASGEAFVARLITARPMLPGRTGPWLERIRRDLADVRVRCLECSARVRLRRGIAAQAARDARLAVEVAPLREPSWRLLMDAHAAAGDVASALDAYERCRAALTEALGVGPSTITRERHAELLAEVE
jgi:DNA-binding SARP family transcriptional activator